MQQYWRVMQGGVAVASLTEYQDELDVLSIMTDWPRMKVSCANGMHRFDRIGRVLRLATAG